MDNNYQDLYEKLSRLQWLMHRHHLHNYTTCGPFANPSRGQGRVLALLKMQPEISTKDLAYLMGIRHQSLNELLNKLEKAEYITRTPSEADRRVSLVKLTDKGKSQQQEQQDVSDIFDCLKQEEQIALADYLDRIIAALTTQLGIDDDEDAANWRRAARSRMGNEMFENLMAMRGEYRRGPFDGHQNE